MIEDNNLANIDDEVVDEVVIGALALLAEGETCVVSSKTPVRPDDITVAVFCDSDQQSAVILRCSYALAKNLTGRMLELEPHEIVPADMVDATGELVNVIAGNLRGLIRFPGAMTAPFLLDQDMYAQLCTGAVNTYSVTGEGMQVFLM